TAPSLSPPSTSSCHGQCDQSSLYSRAACCARISPWPLLPSSRRFKSNCATQLKRWTAKTANCFWSGGRDLNLPAAGRPATITYLVAPLRILCPSHSSKTFRAFVPLAANHTLQHRTAQKALSTALNGCNPCYAAQAFRSHRNSFRCTTNRLSCSAVHTR